NEPIYEARSEVMRTINETRQSVMNDVDPDILRIARALNIDVRDKTKQEIMSEILRRLGEGKSG
ncbi:MAG: DNA replication protein DnaD, partial [Vulcanisaeta sp.]